MSFVARDNGMRGYDHRSRFSLYEDENADQYEEYQSTRSELPAEIPDSQPEPYLPAEIPDSQPDLVYHEDLPFGDPDYSEVSSQLPNRDHGDIDLGDASAYNLGDYDLDEEQTVNRGDCNLDDHQDIDYRVNRFDRVHRKEVDDTVLDEDLGSTSSGDTDIIPGGIQLTNRIVSLYQHPSNPTNLLSIDLGSVWAQQAFPYISNLDHLFLSVRLGGGY